MPRNRLIGIWAVILLLPAVITGGFYLLFKNLNYFALEGMFKGVVASGPIAAYIFLVWFSYSKIYQKMSDSEEKNILSNKVSPLLGEWSYNSHSFHSEKTRNGKLFINLDQGQVIINGDYKDDDVSTGTFHSEMVNIQNNCLKFLYKLKSNDDSSLGPQECWAYCETTYGIGKVDAMEGTWHVMGPKEASGNIKLKRYHD